MIGSLCVFIGSNLMLSESCWQEMFAFGCFLSLYSVCVCAMCSLLPFGLSGQVQLMLSACGDKGITRGAGTSSGVLSSV